MHICLSLYMNVYTHTYTYTYNFLLEADMEKYAEAWMSWLPKLFGVF